jgi:molecular chaperone GrpE
MRSSPGAERESSAAGDVRVGSDTPAAGDQERSDVPAELAAAEERYLRARADLDNYRKRADRELERRVNERTDRVLREWLEVADNVERALAWEGDVPAQEAGLRAVHEQIEAVLDRQGVRRVGETGEPFDPALHEAVAVVPSSQRETGTIAEVVRPGYSTNDRLLRPAQVVVVGTPAGGG